MRCSVLAAFLCLLPLLSAFVLPSAGGAAALTTSRAADVSMAHHVQKKATRGHNAYRPKKSRPSDIYRKPPSYPAFPDIPWYTKLEEKGSTTTTAASQ